jgi:hypothetical protein
MTLKTKVALLMGEFCVLILLGCEITTSARLGSGPTFSLNGSGRLASFTVYAPQPGHKIATPNDAKSEVWSFRVSGSSGGEPVARMELLYGRVPSGYAKTVPSNGVPPALPPDLVYYFFAETTGAAGAEGFFYMDKNIPVPTNVPGLCESNFVGDVKPVKCGTSEAYVEPKDLEKFVQENRVH